MMMKRMFAAAILFALSAASLTGCVSADAAIGDVTASEKFAKICRTEPTVHALFVVLQTQTELPASVVKSERAAHEVVTNICAAPPADVGQALVALADAYAVVLRTQSDLAKRQEG